MRLFEQILLITVGWLFVLIPVTVIKLILLLCDFDLWLILRNSWLQQNVNQIPVRQNQLSTFFSTGFLFQEPEDSQDSRWKERNMLIFLYHFKLLISVDTGRKLNVRKTFRKRPECLMYVQFKSCVYGNEHFTYWMRFVHL